jgi:hypothetical protein
MRGIMYAVYDNKIKRVGLPRSVHFKKWAAEEYIKKCTPPHLKCRIVRVEMVMKSETALDVFTHEYKHLKE